MRRVIETAVILGMVLLAVQVQAADPHPFDVTDMVAMERVSDPQVSPDGTRAAFVVNTMDLEANRGRRDIFVVPLDGSAPAARLTTDPGNDFSPQWADDDTLYFLSDRSGSVQVWRISTSGGEAGPVTDLPLDVDSLVMGPGSHALYLALSVFPDCPEPVECTVGRLRDRTVEKASGMIFDRLFIRHWDTWEDGRRNHVFRLALRADGTAEGAPVDLMKGVDGDCPTKPFGGTEDFTVSPDDHWLVYSTKAGLGSETAWSTNYDLWAVPTDGSKPPTNVTADNPAWDGTPTFSPDGKTLAYLAMKRPGFEADRFRVVLMPWPAGEAKVLTEAWDRSPSELVWGQRGKALYATADNVGNHSLFKIDAATGEVDALLTRHTNSSPRPLGDGGVLLSQDSLVAPAELYLLPVDEAAPRPVTHLNQARLSDLKFGTYEQFHFTGTHGDEVFGYLVYPVGFDATKTYPLAYLIHGGPQGSFDDHFHYRWNPEIYAAHGYVTAMVDFHGSTGYGQDFQDAIRNDWGGAPYQDLMIGLDWLIAHHPFIDGNRMAALGASFGGYMINWIQGHTDRFRALVCHDGNLDETSAYFDTEELWFPEWEHGGTPWENPEGYRKFSPMESVANFKTPELVVHGARDFRVVDTQGFSMFTALQRLGVPSRLLYYPDENHWVLKPANSIQWHHVVLDWIDRWTAPGSGG